MVYKLLFIDKMVKEKTGKKGQVSSFSKHLCGKEKFCEITKN